MGIVDEYFYAWTVIPQSLGYAPIKATWIVLIPQISDPPDYECATDDLKYNDRLAIEASLTVSIQTLQDSHDWLWLLRAKRTLTINQAFHHVRSFLSRIPLA